MSEVILITGAGGTVGSLLVGHIIKNTRDTVHAVERSEQAMAFLALRYGDNPRVKLCLGDLLDPQSFAHAADNVDTVIHCAALKHVAIGEAFPDRQARENVTGFCNIIQIARSRGVKKFLLCSTDKAATPTSVMGATKYLLERICINATTAEFKASAVRFANILGSNGSLLHLIEDRIKKGDNITLRDKRMTRYLMHKHHATDLIFYAVKNMQGGEIFTFAAPTARVEDIMKVAVEHYGGDHSRIVHTQAITRENIDERLFSAEELHFVRKSGSFLSMHGTQGDALTEDERLHALSSTTNTLSGNDLREYLFGYGSKR